MSWTEPTATTDDTLPLSAVLGVVVLLAGLVVAVSTRFLSNPYSTAFPWAAITGSALFLLLRRSRDVQRPVMPELTVGPRHLAVGYFTAVGTVLLLYRASGFETTLAVNVLLLCCYLLTAAVIWLRPDRVFPLALVLATGILHRMLALYSSPLLMGNDTFFHNRMGRLVASTGSLEPLTASKYFYAPFYHVFNALARFTMDVPGREVAALTTTVLAVVLPACAVYWLVDQSWRRQTAVFGALLYTASDFALFWAMQPQVTSVGVGLYALCLASLIAYVRRPLKGTLAVTLVLFAMVSLTHQVSTFITAFSALVYLGCRTIYYRRDVRRAMNLSLIYVLGLIFNFRATKWGGPEGESGDFLHVMTTQVVYAAIDASEDTVSRVAYTLPKDPAIHPASSNALSMIHVVGSAALLGASVTGMLFWMWAGDDRRERASGFAVGSLVGAMFTIVLVGPIAGLRTLLPWRWFAYIYVPAAVLGAVTFVSLSRSVTGLLPDRSSAATVVVVLLLVGPYVAVMGGNFTGAAHDPVYDDSPRAQRFGLTTTEYATLEHQREYVPRSEPVASDYLISILSARNYGQENVRVLDVKYGDPTSIGSPDESVVVVDRAYIHTDHARYTLILNGTRVSVFGPVPVDDVAPTRRSTTYDSGVDKLTYLEPSPSTNETNETDPSAAVSPPSRVAPERTARGDPSPARPRGA